MTTELTQTWPLLGGTKDDLDTPALCLDLDVLDRNIAAVAGICRAAGVAWRPHSKGHKVPAIAQRELDAGALGITCAKLGEAEVMAASGIRDLLIANLIVGPHKLRRLVELRKIADPIVCVDHPAQAEALSRAFAATGMTLRVLIEVDVGLHRAGVALGEPTVALARLIAGLPGLKLAGLMGYEGHLLTLPELSDKEQQIRTTLGSLVETRKLVEAAGIPCEILSVGGTGSFRYSVQIPGVTEVQAGGAIFMDAFYRQKCQVPELEFALTILTTVVSRPAPNRAIIDAGRKSMNIELLPPQVVGRSDVRVTRLSAEHGQLELDPSAQDLRVGDRLELIPGYADLTTMLHEEFYGFRDGRLEVIWPIAGRGKIR